MNTPLVCHFLIGPPGSGKSTLAAQMSQLIANSRIISSDQIRGKLYGDEQIQGDWAEIEQIILEEIQEALAQQQPVIYDATNAKRVWRMGLLQRIADFEAQWVAWHLKTPRQFCQNWNMQRGRQVSPTVLDDLFQSLKHFPPLAGEGFLAIYELNSAQSQDLISEVKSKINLLPRSVINRTNRTQHSQSVLHPYSKLLDFDRLLYLISLLIRYPGIGNLQSTNPDILQQLIGEEIQFQTEISEICAILQRLYGSIYADPNAITADMEWLEANNFLSPIAVNQELVIAEVATINTATHPYSDREAFKRLLTTIRFILQNPFQWNSDQGSLRSLVSAMQKQGLIDGNQTDAIRKDIERILKPFQLLPEFALKRGYFIGTGILSASQLTKVFHVLQAQAKNLQDPIALGILEIFDERMRQSQLSNQAIYPIRAICNRTIVDPQLLPQSALAREIEKLEDEIEQGQLLELKRFSGVGRYAEEQEEFFRIWPLQIVFHNIGWYLGFEIAEGQNQGLLQFERLDRLFRGYPQSNKRDRSQQDKSLKKLQYLYQACGGLYLGTSAADQRQFLSKSLSNRDAVSITVELWFNDYTFRFISEGTQRFPITQMKMSPRLSGSQISQEQASLFSLSKSPDPTHPNRFRVKLPRWSLDDIDLRRWILGFGDQVKVVEPEELTQQIQGIGVAIANLYS
ncbi:WYL domain-containing protein [Calothrix sp. FACHB-1219]|uniref:AAA family ATPase n=1 Tax=unclassified Calothrix TaxID=2619626 RepID=UPI00168533C2|nr:MULTISPECIES: AAA family ATPase [unclassified Calothrix]MBD2206886.1 WYL domain-containing protein [Calothrix sp. FACHB-168]MBD2221504.1 WYL domain-containing protein [Calothrix sp. FACHB-1219]